MKKHGTDVLHRIKLYSERLDVGIKLKDAGMISSKHLNEYMIKEFADIVAPDYRHISKKYN
tara:strand:- start:325 stop:507 length:183 start_codon:yes stop_codon:yes gene_type:complete